MSLTKEELLHLAKLARLRLSEDELETFQPQLDGILAFVGRLKSVEVPADSAEQGEVEAVVRLDVPEQSSPELLQALHSAFPDLVDPFLRVPGVFEKPKD